VQVAAIFASLLDPSLAKLASDAARVKKAQKTSKAQPTEQPTLERSKAKYTQVLTAT
jgi:hypothetical protein